jgi:hypothetical protein
MFTISPFGDAHINGMIAGGYQEQCGLNFEINKLNKALMATLYFTRKIDIFLCKMVIFRHENGNPSHLP